MRGRARGKLSYFFLFSFLRLSAYDNDDEDDGKHLDVLLLDDNILAMIILSITRALVIIMIMFCFVTDLITVTNWRTEVTRVSDSSTAATYFLES